MYNQLYLILIRSALAESASVSTSNLKKISIMRNQTLRKFTMWRKAALKSEKNLEQCSLQSNE